MPSLSRPSYAWENRFRPRVEPLEDRQLLSAGFLRGMVLADMVPDPAPAAIQQPVPVETGANTVGVRNHDTSTARFQELWNGVWNGETDSERGDFGPMTFEFIDGKVFGTYASGNGRLRGRMLVTKNPDTGAVLAVSVCGTINDPIADQGKFCIVMNRSYTGFRGSVTFDERHSFKGTFVSNLPTDIGEAHLVTTIHAPSIVELGKPVRVTITMKNFGPQPLPTGGVQFGFLPFGDERAGEAVIRRFSDVNGLFDCEIQQDEFGNDRLRCGVGALGPYRKKASITVTVVFHNSDVTGQVRLVAGRFVEADVPGDRAVVVADPASVRLPVLEPL